MLNKIHEYINEHPDKILKLYLLSNSRTALKLKSPYGIKILIDDDLSDGDLKILEIIY